MSTQNYTWSRRSLDELEDLYWAEIAPDLRREDRDPHSDRPSYQWLADHGYSGLAYALREKHDLTVKEFFLDVVELNADERATGGTYDWGIVDARTIDALTGFLQEGEWDRLAESTLQARRSYLKKYVTTYARLHETSDLLTPLEEPENLRPERDRVRAVFRDLESELSTDRSRLKYVNAVQQWYQYLLDYDSAEFDPTRSLESRYDPEPADNASLDAHQIRAILDVTESVAERLVVMALAGWGLRRSEVASLHISQIRLTETDPFIEFDERKNGPGTVPIIYGLDVLSDRVTELESDSEWNGYLFPSSQSDKGHRTGGTIGNRFERLADRAEVTLRGETPRSHACRRYWYETYSDSVSWLVEVAREAAEEQGSTDPQTVISNYFTAERRRQLHRQNMREDLAQVFE